MSKKIDIGARAFAICLGQRMEGIVERIDHRDDGVFVLLDMGPGRALSVHISGLHLCEAT